MSQVALTDKPHQNIAYSLKPFYELTDQEIARLSPKTREALAKNNVIYGKAFLANTLRNENGFRITDNKYLAQNREKITGKPMTFGTKVLEKYHHPRFYEEIDVTGMTPEEEKAAFLEFQEKDRIGDILKMEYNKEQDQWDAYYILSHPEIVRDVRDKKLELPQYVSPYFFNENDPAETGDDLREAEILHLSYVDEPAYGVEAARVRAYCDSKDGQFKTCLARMVGAAVIPKDKVNKKPPCACGMMAGFEHKLDSSFYIENPRDASIKMSDQSQATTQTSKPDAQQKSGSENKNNTYQENFDRRQQDALNKMKEADAAINNQGQKDVDNKTKDETNPKIPVEFQDLVNIQVSKEVKKAVAEKDKTIQEKLDYIAKLEKQIEERNKQDRQAIVDKYIPKELYKDPKVYEERKKYYSELADKKQFTNEELESLLKDHWEVKELNVSLTQGKGKGAGIDRSKKGNINIFDNEGGVGMLGSNSYFRGLEAGKTPDGDEEDTGFGDDESVDSDEDNVVDETEEEETTTTSTRGKGAAAILRGL